MVVEEEDIAPLPRNEHPELVNQLEGLLQVFSRYFGAVSVSRHVVVRAVITAVGEVERVLILCFVEHGRQVAEVDRNTRVGVSSNGWYRAKWVSETFLVRRPCD